MMRYLKAIFGAALAAYASLQGSYIATGHIGWGSGFVALGAGLGSLAVIWGIPNKSDAPAPPVA